MSTHRPVARPLRPAHHHGFRPDRADDGAAEAAPGAHRLRHPRRRAGRLERLEGAAPAHALLRDRADPDRRLQRRVARAAARRDARARWRRGSRTGRRRSASASSTCTIPPTGCASTRTGRCATPSSCAAPTRRACSFAFEIRPMAFEGATEITVLAPDHPRLLSVIAGACAASDANIVDAQIFTTTDGRALDTVVVSRAFDDRRGRDAARRAHRAG